MGISEVSILASEEERKERRALLEYFQDCPIPEDHLLSNLGLFISRQRLMRILFFDELYKKAMDLSGVVMEFGVRWGQDLALFHSFRGMYEPYNLTRRIIGFDTFEGFPSIHEKDASPENQDAVKGGMAVTENYDQYLDKVLAYHETESPISHVRRYEIVKGDASVTLKEYLEQRPETVVALAYFDMDIYEPTKNCLELLKPHLIKGSVIGFDELNNRIFPGETLAFQEVLGAGNFRLHRSKYAAGESYITFE